MQDKSTNVKVNFNLAVVFGFILLGLGYMLRLKWMLSLSFLLFLVTFVVSVYFVLKNMNFKNAESIQKKTYFIEGLKAAFLSFSFLLISIYRPTSF